MWRVIRIAVLLFVLATVAQTAWIARSRTAEWKGTLRVAVYPIAGDRSAVTRRHIEALGDGSFTEIETFFATEGRRYALPLAQPVDLVLAPAVESIPPPPPFGASRPQVMLWSLKLRYWAWRNDTHRGPAPHVRLFVSFHDPAQRPRLPHSTGLQKGLLGVVHAFAQDDMSGSNEVVIVHELLHTLGATDKYDRASNQPLYPDGYAEPHAKPLHPQVRAEIMAGRIPLSESRLSMPEGMRDIVIGPATAREIHWVR